MFTLFEKMSDRISLISCFHFFILLIFINFQNFHFSDIMHIYETSWLYRSGGYVSKHKGQLTLSFNLSKSLLIWIRKKIASSDRFDIVRRLWFLSSLHFNFNLIGKNEAVKPIRKIDYSKNLIWRSKILRE